MNQEQENQNYVEHSILVKQMLDIEVFPNLSQQVIMTTEDRLRICLLKNLSKAEKKHDWIAPFGILIAVITAFVTASFKDYLLSAKTWEAIFIIVGIGSGIWLLITIKHAFTRIDIEEIIKEVKSSPKQLNNK